MDIFVLLALCIIGMWLGIACNALSNIREELRAANFKRERLIEVVEALNVNLQYWGRQR